MHLFKILFSLTIASVAFQISCVSQPSIKRMPARRDLSHPGLIRKKAMPELLERDSKPKPKRGPLQRRPALGTEDAEEHKRKLNHFAGRVKIHDGNITVIPELETNPSKILRQTKQEQKRRAEDVARFKKEVADHRAKTGEEPSGNIKLRKTARSINAFQSARSKTPAS